MLIMDIQEEYNSIYPFPDEVIKKCKRCCTPYLVFSLRVFEQVIIEGATEYEHKRRIVCQRINLDTKDLDKDILQRHVKNVCEVLKINLEDVKNDSLCPCGQKIIISLPLSLMNYQKTIKIKPQKDTSRPKSTVQENKIIFNYDNLNQIPVIYEPNIVHALSTNVKDTQPRKSKSKSTERKKQDKRCTSNEIRPHKAKLSTNVTENVLDSDVLDTKKKGNMGICNQKKCVRNVQVQVPKLIRLSEQLDTNEVCVQLEDVVIKDSSQINKDVRDIETQAECGCDNIKKSRKHDKNKMCKQNELNEQKNTLDTCINLAKQESIPETRLQSNTFLDQSPLRTEHRTEWIQKTTKPNSKNMNAPRNGCKMDATCQITTIFEKQDVGLMARSDDFNDIYSESVYDRRDSMINFEFDVTSQTNETILIKDSTSCFKIDSENSQLFDAEYFKCEEKVLESSKTIEQILDRIIKSVENSQTSSQLPSEDNTDMDPNNLSVKKSRVGYDLESLTGESNIDNSGQSSVVAQLDNAKSPTEVEADVRDLATEENTKKNAEHSGQFYESNVTTARKSSSHLSTKNSVKYSTETSVDGIKKNSGRKVSIQESIPLTANKKSSIRKLISDTEKWPKTDLTVSFHNKNSFRDSTNQTSMKTKQDVCKQTCNLLETCDQCLQTQSTSMQDESSSVPEGQNQQECLCPIAMERKMRQMQTDSTLEMQQNNQ